MARKGSIEIINPKQNPRQNTQWGRFFPYYAGYPEKFATLALQSLHLRRGALVLDPWNGSGTTSYAAAQLGLSAVGVDINPAMAVVAKARLLPSSESSALVPLGIQIVESCEATMPAASDDPLCAWFGPRTCAHLRGIEQEIRRLLIGRQFHSLSDIGSISSIASILYVALFSVARLLAAEFRSSNPTWLRVPRGDERRISASKKQVNRIFERQLAKMADALANECVGGRDIRVDIGVADSVSLPLADRSVDAVLTSPPYCTRIDYATTTRVELAVLSGLVPLCHVELGRRMLGSLRVPKHDIEPQVEWGHTCGAFIERIAAHGSKASSGYYLKTHLDYFDKLNRSLSEVSRVLGRDGVSVMVVQDSYYKDVHNDVPKIVEEISAVHHLKLIHRKNFPLRKSMAAINRGAKAYRTSVSGVEAVLCFQKD